jgi:hypothetical protein
VKKLGIQKLLLNEPITDGACLQEWHQGDKPAQALSVRWRSWGLAGAGKLTVGVVVLNDSERDIAEVVDALATVVVAVSFPTDEGQQQPGTHDNDRQYDESLASMPEGWLVVERPRY